MSNGKKEWQDFYYICPVCKQPLTLTTNGLFCQQEGVEYSIKNGIVDFILEDLTMSTSPVLRAVDKIDNFAEIYEGSWYGAVDAINAESGLPSSKETAKMMTEMVDAENGVGLDVACGTGVLHQTFSTEDAPCLWDRHIYGHAGEGDRICTGERDRKHLFCP